ncbi:MAG: SH3 domain-containing protein [Anaerolineaceae bacterium]|nr:SH3 domain-containing protein [Anaerolineaceae bacterium]
MRLGNYTFNSRYGLIVIGLVLVVTAACTTNTPSEQSAGVATDTLAPLVTFTPRFTATPVPSRTPLPTFTLTPSDTPISPTPSNTPTASATPPVTGIVASINTVNVREGPSVSAGAIVALKPGTGVQILATSPDSKWFNIRMDDGREGWIAAELVRVNPVPTEFPTATPSPNLTALAQGTLLPTAVLGGGTITPTPPRSVITPTEVGSSAAASNTPASSAIDGTLPPLPVIDVNAINLTATAMALPTSTATFTPVGADTATPSIPFVGVTFTPSAGGVGGEGNTGSQSGVDVLAYCDNKAFGRPAPTNLLAGATIDVFWSWFVKDRDLIQQHLDNVVYDVKVDGKSLDNWREYASSIRKQNDGNYYIFWYVPAGPLASGQHSITYNVSWKAQISDGYDNYGPGTNKPSESGSCTFTVK